MRHSGVLMAMTYFMVEAAMIHSTEMQETIAFMVKQETIAYMAAAVMTI